ncbi:MAG: DUF2812 domain-containing protein [Lachnospiraceae bacterium]|nr:DUF2812 domain-containing protein [Lachnospiraceae bacterium]
MRETKRRIPQFTFYDKTGIQRYLEKQASQGWMLQKISCGWVFRRIEPKKILFFVTYFYKKSIFEPEGSEEQKRFWEFCEHAGWKLAATNEQMQIFYNEEEDPVPIETDTAMEVEKISRSAWKSFLLPYILLLVSFFLHIGSVVERMHYDPLSILADDMDLLILCSWCLLAVYVIREIVRYFFWHRKAVRYAEAGGGFAPTRGVGKIWSVIPFAALFCVAAGMVLFGDSGTSHAFFWMLLMLGISMALITGISRWMRHIGVKAAFNRLTVIGLTTFVGIVMLQQLFMMIIRGELFPGREAAETYEYNGWTFEVYCDKLPLTVEDLFGENSTSFDKRYSYELTEKESVFLLCSEAVQDPRADAEDLPWIRYTAAEVKVPFLYKWCVKRTIDKYAKEDIDGETGHEAMYEIEEELWGADVAYRIYRGEETKEKYVICYENVILELDTSWELTAEQIAVVKEKFGGE